MSSSHYMRTIFPPPAPPLPRDANNFAIFALSAARGRNLTNPINPVPSAAKNFSSLHSPRHHTAETLSQRVFSLLIPSGIDGTVSRAELIRSLRDRSDIIRLLSLTPSTQDEPVEPQPTPPHPLRYLSLFTHSNPTRLPTLTGPPGTDSTRGG